MPLVHHVFFWLTNPDSQADKEALIKGLKTLTQISAIQSFHIGTPAPTNRDVIERSYSVSWLCFFENLETEEVYQQHPIHLEFINNCKHLWQKVVVFDSI